MRRCRLCKAIVPPGKRVCQDVLCCGGFDDVEEIRTPEPDGCPRCGARVTYRGVTPAGLECENPACPNGAP